MKKFLKKLATFILPLFLGVLVVSFLLKKYINSKTDFSLPKNITSIILGHSQPEGAFNDSLITNTKNLCNGGEAYLYSFKKLQIVLEHNPQVKTVFVSFSNNQIEERMTDWTYDESHLDQYFKKFNFAMDYSDYKQALQYDFSGVLKSELNAIIANSKTILRNRNAFENNNFGGYLYLKRFKTDSLIKSNYIQVIKKKQTNGISQVNLDYLKKIAAYCKNKNVKLYLFRCPMHQKMFEIVDEKQFQRIRKEQFSGIPFLDYHDFPLTNDEFGDFDHLNYKGAKKFSEYFNSEMKKQ
jgi:peroxiredoxin family protein